MINLPIGIAALRSPAAGCCRIRRGGRSEPIPDLAGSVLLTIAVAALTGAIVQGPTLGLGLGRGRRRCSRCRSLALVAFGWRCTHHRAPLFELELLRVRAFVLATSATFVFSIAFAIMLLSNALWCESVWHYSALRTGLAMAPGPAVVPFATPPRPGWCAGSGAGRVSAVGCVLFAAGLLWRVVFVGCDARLRRRPAAVDADRRHRRRAWRSAP